MKRILIEAYNNSDWLTDTDFAILHYNEKQQPHLVMRGFAQSIKVDKINNTIIIE